MFIRFNARRGQPKPITLVALLDTGASCNLIEEKYTKKLKLHRTRGGTQWSTPAGEMKTTATCKSQFTIPKLHDNRLIEWEFHVTKSMGAYDMIIGRDMLDDLGFILNFDEHVVTWEHASVPFKDMENDIFENFHIDKPDAVEESMGRIKKILDNTYAAADLHEVTTSQSHLSREEQDKLEKLLQKYEILFDGTLGRWTQPDYHLELKSGAKPYHAKAFPASKKRITDHGCYYCVIMTLLRAVAHN